MTDDDFWGQLPEEDDEPELVGHNLPNFQSSHKPFEQPSGFAPDEVRAQENANVILRYLARTFLSKVPESLQVRLNELASEYLLLKAGIRLEDYADGEMHKAVSARIPITITLGFQVPVAALADIELHDDEDDE